MVTCCRHFRRFTSPSLGPVPSCCRVACSNLSTRRTIGTRQDLNGDGIDDVVIGAFGDETSERCVPALYL